MKITGISMIVVPLLLVLASPPVQAEALDDLKKKYFIEDSMETSEEAALPSSEEASQHSEPTLPPVEKAARPAPKPTIFDRYNPEATQPTATWPPKKPEKKAELPEVKKDPFREEIDLLFKKADRLSDKGDRKGAVEVLTKIIGMDPQNVKAFFKRGNALGFLGEYRKALSDFSMIRAIAPSNAKVRHKLGFCRELLGEYDKAIENYGKAIEFNPQSVVSYFYRANLFAALGEYDKAIHDYGKVVEIKPDYYAAYFKRAGLKLRLGQLEEARTDYLKVIQINPQHAESHADLAELDILSGNYSEASAILQKAKGLSPGRDFQILIAYLDCVAQAARGLDTAPSEARLNALVEGHGFQRPWTLNLIETWLENVNIGAGPRVTVYRLTEMLRNAQKDSRDG